MFAEIYIAETICILILLTLPYFLFLAVRAFLRTPKDKRMLDSGDREEGNTGLFVYGPGYWRPTLFYWILVLFDCVCWLVFLSGAVGEVPPKPMLIFGVTGILLSPWLASARYASRHDWELAELRREMARSDSATDRKAPPPRR